MVANFESIAKHLKQAGYSLTEPRKAVYAALLDSEAVSMRQLIDKLPDVDRSSVYRTVELYEKLGVINRLQIGWKYRLELSDLFNLHHHHAVCTNCAKIIPLEEDSATESSIRRLAEKHNLHMTDHSLEISGLCGDCQSKQPA